MNPPNQMTEVTKHIETLPQCQLIALNAALAISVSCRQPLAQVLKENNIEIPDECRLAIQLYTVDADLRASSPGRFWTLYPLLEITSNLILANYNSVGSLLIARSFITHSRNSQECVDFVESGYHLGCDLTLADADMACQQWGEELQVWLQSHK